jgi:hypothetical protein
VSEISCEIKVCRQSLIVNSDRVPNIALRATASIMYSRSQTGVQIDSDGFTRKKEIIQ